ncbi:MAG: hypothetical protein IJU87_01160 [Lachnospiraceae bacterium]|nr:hypothetical protein [Lachnospiraceae bacterium]
MHKLSGDEYEVLKRYFYSKTEEDDSACIDDITWNDLEMDSFFKRFNNTCSQNGGEYFYDMLRRPLVLKEDLSKLRERGRVSELFRSDSALRDKYRKAFETDEAIKRGFHEMLQRLENVRRDSLLLHFAALVLALISLAFIFINPFTGFILFIAASLFNVTSYFRRKGEIESFIPVIRYLIREIRECRALTSIEHKGLSEYSSRLKAALDSLRGIDRNAWIILSGKRLTGGFLELPLDFIRIFFHIDLIKFDLILDNVRENREAVKELFEVTGFLDSMTALSILKDELRYFSEPVFKDQGGIELSGLYHPLLTEPVPCDVENVSLMLLTGSNASGKSTFLKAAAISLILAETLYTVPAKKMVLCPVEILSSMSLRDSIEKGDSLYVTEIRSIKRIADRLKVNRDCAIFLDEVLKGTNTVERIASLSVLLKSFSEARLCFAATHDTPLTHILEDIYENYHFDENVTEDGITFPYELKKGRTDSRDAIMLLSVMGLDRAVTDEAFELSDAFLKEGVWKKL